MFLIICKKYVLTKAFPIEITLICIVLIFHNISFANFQLTLLAENFAWQKFSRWRSL